MTEVPQPGHPEIEALYEAFNARDMEGLLALLSEDVDWPNGDGRLHGRTALREHWSRQWAQTQTHDAIAAVDDLSDGRIAVRISQTVRNLQGAVMSTGTFEQTYAFRDGLVAKMDMRRL